MKIVVLLLAIATSVHAAAVWNQFRGPNGSGVADGCRPPVEIGKDSLAWTTPVPPGLSAPVLGGGKIFLTAFENGRLVTLALDRATGKPLWRREAPEVPIEKVHKANHPAAPTPLADESRLYVYFGSFGLLCYDHDGNEHWQRPIPTPKTLYGMATSLIGYGDKVILVLDNDANLPGSKLSASRVAAFRKNDGSIAWETGRPVMRSGWSTPALWRHNRGTELVVLGSGTVHGYDPGTGAEKWYASGFSRETIAVPVAGDGKVYVSSAQLGGGADAAVDPEPFWNAMLRFDADRDGKVARGEMTGHFTLPLRPELPLGHPGFGLPLPKDPKRRKDRQHQVFGWIDRDRDGHWTKEELAAHLTVRRGRPLLMAIRPGGTGDISKTHVAWELNRSIPEVPSPIFYDRRLYLVRNGGLLAAIDPATGRQLYRGRLAGGGGYSASPVAANGHLYTLSDEGVLSVVTAGPTFELAHQLALDEPATVTPAIDADTIYVRSEGHLLAFRRTP